MENTKKKKKSPFLLVTIIIIILLSVVLALVTLTGLIEMRDRYQVKVVPTNELMEMISREDYSGVLHAYYSDNSNLNTKDKERKECFAVSRYFEDGIMFKIFSSSGDCIRASKYRAMMTKEIDNMGDLVLYKTSVDEQLGIE